MTIRDEMTSRLAQVGIAAYSEERRRILAEMSSDGFRANNAVFAEASSEAIIRAVAAMIKENNIALLNEMF